MIISVLNTKGGCGKSTVAINVAAGLAHSGLDTLLVDTDKTGTSLEWASQREENQAKLNVAGMPNARALKNAIRGFAEKHEVIVIDGAPQLEDMLTISVAVSHLVLIPVIPSPNDLWKLGPMVELIKQVRETNEQITGQRIQVCFLVNNYVPRTRLSQEVASALDSYEIPVLEAKLGTRMDYRDSLGQGTAAIEFSNVKAKEEIAALLDEIKGLFVETR